MSYTQKYFWALILLAVALGFIWPAPGLLVGPTLTYLLMLMMFFSCLKINISDLKEASHNWWRYLALMGIIFIVPPVMIFIFKKFLPDLLYVGLLLAGASPSAVAVVFLSDLFGGQPAKAMVATTLAHLVSPILTPLIVWIIAGRIVHVDFVSMMVLIFKVVIVPLVLAQIVKITAKKSAKFPDFQLLNIGLLFVLVWGIIAPSSSLIVNNLIPFLFASALVAVVLLVQFYAACVFGRNIKEDVTWSVVLTYKNFTLASVLAMSVFGPLAALGAAAYGIVNNLMLVFLPPLAKKLKL